MAKKKARRSPDEKKEVDDSGFGHEKTSNVQKILVENFVSLQDVMADLSAKFSNLASQMSKLLGLFEQSAKTFMEKDLKFAGGTDKELVGKLDRLIEQNRIIAQGITMLYEERSSQENKPEQFAPAQFPPEMNPENVNRYQKSISSKQDAKTQTRTNLG